MSFFISSAIAQTANDAAAAAGPSPYFNFILIGAFIVIFYFMIWRPQSKRANEVKNLLSALAKGDEVITNSGILGRVTKVDDLYITLQVADNLELKMQKSAVAGVLPKGTLKSI
ncbi:MAG TPA: preprotein translocase subunit YajC [Candidatus Acidoferrum sp.]|nr:preprotein translocase subunit YajC [Candidatus Acidoferrum sp.]